ncbi:hypothetical protein EV581_104102 [Bacillus sp. BK006]|jgi:hypothetical protein|nr:hypothetical protein EV581_104102 [Bacillus sp. BK006]
MDLLFFEKISQLGFNYFSEGIHSMQGQYKKGETVHMHCFTATSRNVLSTLEGRFVLITKGTLVNNRYTKC